MAVVVIGRTNKGLLSELLKRRDLLKRWPRWALVDDEGTSIFDVASYGNLLRFYNGGCAQFRWKGEDFATWDVLKEA
eukprot:1451172-Rhodomonas_salina.1